jgi:hypothetical protein
LTSGEINNQQANLRIVLQRADSYALLARLTVQGDNIYCGIHNSTRSELLRSSHHGTGDRHAWGWKHTYVADRAKRIDGGPAIPPSDMKGCQRIWAIPGDPESVEWDYLPKPESGTRHNFTINIDDLAVPCTVDVWIIERGRPDVLLDVIKLHHDHPAMRPLAFSKVIDWTHPQILAVATVPSPEVIESLERTAREQGFPPGKIGGIVVGPGPPVVPIVEIPLDDDEKA